MRARTFLLFWLAGTLGVLAYAGADLWMNPWLHQEMGHSMTPDWDKVWDLQHWGGRLLRHGAWPLLVSNALIFGGLIALVVSTLLQLIRGKGSEVDRVAAYDEDEECPITLRSYRGEDLED